MREKVLAPIKEKPEDYAAIERQLKRLFLKEMYLPLVEALGVPKNVLKNSREDLLTAIQSGQIEFYRGSFKGRFNSTISRELSRLGAVWDKKQGSWKIPLSSLPIEVKNAISASEARIEQTLRRVDDRLSKILPEKLADKVEVSESFDKTMWRVERDFKASVEGLAFAPELTKEQIKKIRDEYTENMKIKIKAWSEEAIIKLRKNIQAKASAGVRAESLVGSIQERLRKELGISYQESLNKAKFLARQETSLVMSKFKEVRYKDAGVNSYIWGCVAGSKNHPVRPDHKKLEGRKFTWDNPPIVNDKGDRKNPGEDYNCRCFAKPIVRF